MIEVNMNYFRAAAECQPTEETRYYLNGVFIAPHPEKGVLLTATDGHRLMTLYDASGKCPTAKICKIDPKAIDARAYASMRKAMPEEIPQIRIDDDGIVTVGTYRSLKSCFVDGVYPDWAAVVRPVLARAKEAKYCPASYNQKYVSAFGKIATMLSPSGDMSASIRVISFTESDPSLMRFGSIDHAFGILMPMRSSSSNELPIWMRPVLEPKPEVVEPAKEEVQQPVAAAPSEPEIVKPVAKKAKPKAKHAARRPASKRKPSRPVKKSAKRKAA